MGKRRALQDWIEDKSKLFNSMSGLVQNMTLCLMVVSAAGNTFIKQIVPQIEGVWTWINFILCVAVILLILLAKYSDSNSPQEEEKQSTEKLKREESELIESLKKEVAETAEKLKQQEAESEKKDKIIRDLESKMEVLEKVLNMEIPVEAGYYMVNKPAYDMFRTDLHIRKCILEVRLKEKKGAEKEYNLEFKWKLVIKNNDSEPVRKVHFIYSGERGMYEHPRVTCEELGCRGVTIKDENNEVEGIKTIGDDRFIEISFRNELKEAETENICIEYVLENYTFNCKRDTIWLVPDALGFAEISEFCIRFIWDGVIIKDKTKAKLTKYRLSGRYPKEQSTVQQEEYQQKDSSGKMTTVRYFEAEGSESMDGSLHGVGYVLTLINKETYQAKP